MKETKVKVRDSGQSAESNLMSCSLAITVELNDVNLNFGSCKALKNEIHQNAMIRNSQKGLNRASQDSPAQTKPYTEVFCVVDLIGSCVLEGWLSNPCDSRAARLVLLLPHSSIHSVSDRSLPPLQYGTKLPF